MIQNNQFQPFIPCDWCGLRSVVWTYEGTLCENCFDYIKMQEKKKVRIIK